MKEKENEKHHHLQIIVSSSDVNTIESVYECNLWKLEKHTFVLHLMDAKMNIKLVNCGLCIK